MKPQTIPIYFSDDSPIFIEKAELTNLFIKPYGIYAN